MRNIIVILLSGIMLLSIGCGDDRDDENEGDGVNEINVGDELNEVIEEAHVSDIKQMEAKTKSNLHYIQIALERYKMDHDGLYPSDSATLTEGVYMDKMPMNSFTEEPMTDIEFGSEPFEGRFTYIPVDIDGQIIGFYLLGYGSVETQGMDVNKDGTNDHVVDVLVSQAHLPGSIQMVDPLPPLEDLL